MKKTLLLLALFISMTVASTAQTTYPIQDTVAAVAPHLPTITRHTGAGDCWHGLTYTYTFGCRDSVLAWALAYPWEATGYTTSVGAYLTATDVSTLSSGEAEVYRDLKAVHMMVIDR